MKRDYTSVIIATLICIIACCSCTKDSNVSNNTNNDKELATINFTNAEFIYNGDDIGDSLSDGWLIKLYTDMEFDDMGQLVGPGSVMQLLLNVSFDEGQQPKLSNLEGEYISQSYSGDFASGTFVYGYMDIIDTPNGRIEIPDATFYASLAEGSTEMDVDLLDDGKIVVELNDDGTVKLSGTVVGKKCRKHKFEWVGTPEIESEVIYQTPNSLLKGDLELTTLTQAYIEDRGDSFYLGDNSYRCFLVYLADDSISFEWGKPVGSGNVLRLDLLVNADTEVGDGIPEGEYPMLVRNADTSINREDISPYHAVSGLPNCFTPPYWSGCWYVQYDNGTWGSSYARIDSGCIRVERANDGSHRFICQLKDCSQPAFNISTDVRIANNKIVGPEISTPDKELVANSYSIDGQVHNLNSVYAEMLGENVYIVGTKSEGIGSAMDIFECDEYIYAAVSPTLVGCEIDLNSENNVYTIISTLAGACIEELSPGSTVEITSGKMILDYVDSQVTAKAEIVLTDGTNLRFHLSAKKEMTINENTISRDSERKPLRTAFYSEEGGITYLYFTPAGIEYFEELEIATWYLYFVIDSKLIDGSKHTISSETLRQFGLVDNFDSSKSFELSNMQGASGEYVITKNDTGNYTAIINIMVDAIRYGVEYNGMCISSEYKPEEKSNYLIYNGSEHTILSATLTEGDVYAVTFKTDDKKSITLTAPASFFNGNAYGFSQSADFTVTYENRTYSKANGDMGTLTALYSSSNTSLEVSFTNYSDLEFSYKGQVTIK